MQQSRTPASMLAILFLALMLAALVARFWVTDKGHEFTGPTHIAAAGDHVYLHAGGDLYILSGSGVLIGVMPPERIGLNDIPIDLRVLNDGSLLLAEQDPASIRLCQVEPWQCRPVGVAIASLVKRQFKVLYFPARNELVFTDARGDTLWKLTDAEKPQKLVPERTLAGPNDLAFDAAGNLWVADTDHRRIVELRPLDDGTFQPGREHSAKNNLTVGERHFPMMLSRAPDGRWWVIQATEFSRALADIVIYDSDEGAQAVIDLPKGAYPTDIASLGETMLVTDLERFTVYRVDSRTLAVSEFGNEEFRSRLKQIRASRNYYERLGAGSMVAIIVFAVLMLFAAIRATPKNKRWTEPPGLLDIENAPERVPETKGIHWLERDPKWDRTLKWLETLSIIPLIGYIVLTVGLYGWARSQAGPGPAGELALKLDELGVVLLSGGICLAALIPAFRLQLSNLRTKLGTDGKHLYIRLIDGRELSVEPSRVFYTMQAIFYRQYTIPLRGMRQKSIYIPEEAETWLAPLLRQARKLTVMEALKYRWKNRDGVLLWSIAAGGVAALVVIVLKTF